MNKFDLPAFFDREYYESRYLMHMQAGTPERTKMAKMWENFYFDNAVAFAYCKTFNVEKLVLGPKKAMELAENVKKEMEKRFK
jgi:hypothetical protein